MILLVFIFAVPAILGALVLSWFKAMSEKMTVLLVGTIAGLSLFTTLTYVASLATGLQAKFIIAELFIFAAAAAWLVKRGAWQEWIKLPLDKTTMLVFIILLLLFSLIAPKLLMERPDGLFTGIINAYGDIGWHLANITMFAEGQSFPPENPIFADTKLTYPFLSNFFSAILLVAGASLPTSVNLPALLLIPLLLTLFFCLAREYTSNNKVAASAALLLLLFGGATFGWIRWADDLKDSGASVAEFLIHLPARDYSGVGTDEAGWHFLNPITTLLLPQRSFLFGLPLAFAILLLLRPDPHQRASSYAAAGILAGALPLFHGHTVLVLVPAIIALYLLRPGRLWLYFATPALLLGIPEVLYYLTGEQQGGSFLRFAPGWTAGQENIFAFWFKNTGLLIPLAVWGMFTQAPRAAKHLAAAGLVLLGLGNLFLFAPWVWDNFKILVFWLIFSLPLIGWLAHRAWAHGNTILKAAVIVLMVVHTLSASLDIWKITLPTAARWIEWDRASIETAQRIKEVTRPGASIATAPIHNSAVVLAGRPRYLGYSAHVWSHGGRPWQREAALASFFQGRAEALAETQPDYVLIGPIETSAFAPIVVRADWSPVMQHAGYTLYKLP